MNAWSAWLLLELHVKVNTEGGLSRCTSLVLAITPAFNCTQGSNYGGKTGFMSPDHFEQAVESLGFQLGDANRPGKQGHYFGVVGVFGGNPALSPHFADYCVILRDRVPFNQRGLWCNNPVTLEKAKEMAITFDPSVSNLNTHMDQKAFDLFKLGWPASQPFGLHDDSRHSPVLVAMKDVVRKGALMEGEGGLETSSVPNDSRIWELISNCDINQHWSAMIGVFRGELRAWFCEIAGAQAMLHQYEPDYPDTGLDPRVEHETDGSYWHEAIGDGGRSARSLPWWRLPMIAFDTQVRKHCFDCGVPLRGYGELALSKDLASKEQCSATHEGVAKPKRPERRREIVTDLLQLGTGKIGSTVRYLQNARV